MTTHENHPHYRGLLQKQPGLVAFAFTILVGGLFVGALAVEWRHAQHERRTGEPMGEEMRSHHHEPGE